MKYQVNMTIEVDPDANFFEFLGDDSTVVKELLSIAVFELDDVKLLDIEVYE